MGILSEENDMDKTNMENFPLKIYRPVINGKNLQYKANFIVNKYKSIPISGYRKTK